MRWIVLLLVISVVMALGNWAYHLLDNVFLISDYWQSTSSIEKWGLVDFQGDKPTVYAMKTANGFWPIFKTLWPVWGLFATLFLILIPVTIFIYNGFNNHQIEEAQAQQKRAEERAEKRVKDAKKIESESKAWATKKVNSAYETQLKRVNSDLDSKWEKFHQERNALLEREQTISEREQLISAREQKADQKVKQIQQEYQQELKRFEDEKATYTKSRNNAVSAMMRRKKREPSII